MKKYSIEEIICAFCMIIMLCIIFVNIVGRTFWGASISFSQELVVYLFVVASIVGAAAACAEGANMGLSLVTDHLPLAAQKVFAIIGCIASVILFAVLFKQGLETAISMFQLDQRTPILRWPAGIFELAYPLGSAFYIFRVIQVTWKKVKGIGEGH